MQDNIFQIKHFPITRMNYYLHQIKYVDEGEEVTTLPAHSLPHSSMLKEQALLQRNIVIYLQQI